MQEPGGAEGTGGAGGNGGAEVAGDNGDEGGAVKTGMLKISMMGRRSRYQKRRRRCSSCRR